MAPRLHRTPKHHDRFTPRNNIYVEQKHQNTTEDCHQPKPPIRKLRHKVYSLKNHPVPSYLLFCPYLPLPQTKVEQINNIISMYIPGPNNPTLPVSTLSQPRQNGEYATADIPLIAQLNYIKILTPYTRMRLLNEKLPYHLNQLEYILSDSKLAISSNSQNSIILLMLLNPHCTVKR